MYLKIIRNDISKSKLVTFTTMLFIASAAMLVSLVVILTLNLSGAINTLMTQAKTPHFMQMHSGTIDSVRLENFVSQNSNIDEFQVAEFLGIDGDRIVIDGKSLAGSVQDNGFCIQNEKFDFLLDLDGNVINVSDGEIYVPIAFMKSGTAKIGDRVSIHDKQLTVAGFLRDSQMNSMLAASKRSLISKNDFAQIKEFANTEYLIEFRLKDLSKLGAFETAYTSAGLEANGPTLTYALFKTINAISDGLMIAVILLVSALVVAIAFMCIRFTLLAKIEDDYREIGVMKAIGLHVSDIKKIYLAKYAAIAAAGSILGFALAFVFKGMLLENMRLYMGESGQASLSSMLGTVGVLIVFLAMLAYVNGVLKRFRKISAAEAVRFGTSQEKSTKGRHFTLSKNKLYPTNIFLGIKDVLARKKLYVTMLMIFVISAFILIVPQNLHNTISSKDFIQYMGIGTYDLRIDIQQTEHISRKAQEIAKTMENDSTINRYTLLTTKTFTVKMEDGSEQNIKIELGDHSVFPIKYASGKSPTAADEIALSAINADELGKKVGDTITLISSSNEKKFKVCGIYSDFTNGGKTAKAIFTDNSADVMWSILCAELKDEALVDRKVSEYARYFSFAKVSSVDEYIMQMFGSTKNSIGKAANAAIAISLIITALITLLFMKMLIAKDRYSIAVMKAFGFTNRDITKQYISRSVFVLIIGIAVGTLLANTLGEILAGILLSSFGASSFKFVINPLSAYLLCPLMLVFSVLIATLLSTSGIEQIKISANIKE